MRLLAVAGLLGLAVIAVSGCQKGGGVTPGGQAVAATGQSASLTPASLPQRKPGLWEQSMTFQEQGKAASQPIPATQMCVDAASEKQMGILTAQLSKDCPNAVHISRNLDGSFSVSGVCDRGSSLGKNSSTGTVTGDFNTAYEMDIDSVTTGASTPSMNKEEKMTLKSRWLGPCPAGWTGGDVGVNGKKLGSATNAGG